jgi:hypothetical protein
MIGNRGRDRFFEDRFNGYGRFAGSERSATEILEPLPWTFNRVDFSPAE